MKEGFLKKLTGSNRFWGFVLIIAGSGVALIPGLQVIGASIVAGGIGQVSVGVVNQVKRTREEEKKAPDKVESPVN